MTANEWLQIAQIVVTLGIFPLIAAINGVKQKLHELEVMLHRDFLKKGDIYGKGAAE